VTFGFGERLVLAEAGPPFAELLELTLDGPVSDALLAGRRLIVVVAGRRLGLIDLGSPAAGATFVTLEPPPRGDLSLSLGGGRLLVAEDELGTRVFRMEPLHGAGHGHGVAEHVPRLTQIDLWPSEYPTPSDPVSAGRLRYVAAGDEGLLLFRDQTEGAQLHSVNVLNDFFSPQQLDIAVGDSVKWSNAAGFHNVRSCFPQQNGCDDQTSNESFGSGPPADPIWSYTYEFQLPGSNPYLCQSHAPFMTGFVEVNATTPPGVPDGTIGTPLTVAKLDASGSVLSVAWDTTSCWGATDHQILYGVGDQLPGVLGGTVGLTGAQCSIGVVSPFVWSLPPELLDPQLVWWIVVTTNGQSLHVAARVGDGGVATAVMDALGDVRSVPVPFGSSGECGIGAKDLSNPCGQ
jgi:plastocyanin